MDLDVLLQAARGRRAEMWLVLKFYLEQTPPLIDRLSQAIQLDQPDQIVYLAHTLAGSSAACGVLALREPVRDIERLARLRQGSGLAELEQRLRDQYRRVEVDLAQKMAEESISG